MERKMAVLIRKMVLPKNCSFCAMFHHNKCQLIGDEDLMFDETGSRRKDFDCFSERHNKCPLIYVPDVIREGMEWR